MNTPLDKERLKNMIKEILIEEPDFLKSLIDEIIQENYLNKSESNAEREARLSNLIDQDFTKYKDVFKDLA